MQQLVKHFVKGQKAKALLSAAQTPVQKETVLQLPYKPSDNFVKAERAIRL